MKHSLEGARIGTTDKKTGAWRDLGVVKTGTVEITMPDVPFRFTPAGGFVQTGPVAPPEWE